MTATLSPPPGVTQKPALEAQGLTRGGSLPRHPDGFNGARDAAILEAGDWYCCHGISVIQATARTTHLLKRAGFSRVRTHAFYEVPVKRDWMGRMQLATKEESA